MPTWHCPNCGASRTVPLSGGNNSWTCGACGATPVGSGGPQRSGKRTGWLAGAAVAILIFAVGFALAYRWSGGAVRPDYLFGGERGENGGVRHPERGAEEPYLRGSDLEPGAGTLSAEWVCKLHDSDPTQRLYALACLGGLQECTAMQLSGIVSALNDSVPAVRFTAFSCAWGIQLKMGRALPEVTKAINEWDPAMLASFANGPDRAARCPAIQVLQVMGPKAKIAIPNLVDALRNDENRTVRLGAGFALMAIDAVDERAAMALEAAKNDSDSLVRGLANRIAALSGRNVDTSVLCDMLRTPKYRDWALGRLVTIGPDALPVLVERLEDGETRSYVILALAALGRVSIPALASALMDHSRRAGAAVALERIGRGDDCDRLSPNGQLASSPRLEKLERKDSKCAHAVLADALCDRDMNEPFQRDLIALMKRIGQRMMPSLIQALRDTNGKGRQQAGIALGVIGQNQPSCVVPQLTQLLADSDPLVRRLSLYALAFIGPRAIDAADRIRALESDPAFRDDVRRALERIEGR